MTNNNVVYGLVREGKTLATADGVVCFTTPEAALEAKKAMNLEETKGITTSVQAFSLSRTVLGRG